MIRALAIVAAMSIAAPAAAQEDADDFPGGEYFYDAGAVGLVYAPLAIMAAIELGLDPPRSPRLFSSSEGGARRSGDTVPEPYVGIGGALLATAIFVPNREGRWFHIEGMAQSLSLTLMFTSIGKNLFGRHRPHWSASTDDNPDTRRSFPSGHSSTAFSIASYACLFLNRDGLDLVGALGCSGALAAAGLTAYSRIRDHRHHLTDVLAGGLLGTGMSMTTFIIQETRYRDRRDPASARVGAGWAF